MPTAADSVPATFSSALSVVDHEAMLQRGPGIYLAPACVGYMISDHSTLYRVKRYADEAQPRRRLPLAPAFYANKFLHSDTDQPDGVRRLFCQPNSF
jgi:hypothetical protein